MSMIDASAAPTFSGPTPPDRVEMELEDLYSAVLSKLRSAPPDGETMMSTRAFIEALVATMSEWAMQAQAAQGMAPGAEGGEQPSGTPASPLSGPTSPYGSGQPGTSDAKFPF